MLGMLHEQITFAEQNPGITDIVQNHFGQRSIDKAKLGVGLPQICKANGVCSQAAGYEVVVSRGVQPFRRGRFYQAFTTFLQEGGLSSVVDNFVRRDL